jgi:hypothetical protein
MQNVETQFVSILNCLVDRLHLQVEGDAIDGELGGVEPRLPAVSRESMFNIEIFRGFFMAMFCAGL